MRLLKKKGGGSRRRSMRDIGWIKKRALDEVLRRRPAAFRIYRADRATNDYLHAKFQSSCARMLTPCFHEYHRGMNVTAIRSSVLHCLRDPGLAGDASAIEYLPDVITLVRDGHIEKVGLSDALLPTLGADVRIDDHRGKILVPGFIDTHVHYPQVDVIGAYGTQLLDWLNRYTFPAEIKFADRAFADTAATFFLDRLLENGKIGRAHV